MRVEGCGVKHERIFGDSGLEMGVSMLASNEATVKDDRKYIRMRMHSSMRTMHSSLHGPILPVLKSRQG